MAKIVSILPEVGLMEWEDDGRHCQVYSYIMIIENDEGKLEMHPIASLDDIYGDRADGIIKWHETDKMKIIKFVSAVDFNEFVKSEQDFAVENCTIAIDNVVCNLCKSKVDMSSGVRESLLRLKNTLNELFKND